MELRTRNGNRRLLVAVVALAVTASHAQASSLARQCRKACVDEIAACVATGRRARDCRRDIVRVCIGQGIATCDPTADSSSTSHNLRLSSSGLSAPASLSASGVSTSAIVLSWLDTNTKEAGYIVERALAPGTSFTAIATVGKNTHGYTDSGLVPATTYYYRVQAYGRGGSYSAYSNVSSATTFSLPDTTPPTVPTGLTATPVTCSQVNVAWNASIDSGTGLKGYNVYRGGAFVKQVLAPAVSTSDGGLAPATIYTYAVSAVDMAGNESARSSPASAATGTCPTTTSTSTTTTTTTTKAPTTTTTTTTTKPPTTTTTSTTIATTTSTTARSTTTTTATTTTTTSPPTTTTIPPTTTTTSSPPTTSTTTTTRATTTTTSSTTTTTSPTTTTTSTTTSTTRATTTTVPTTTTTSTSTTTTTVPTALNPTLIGYVPGVGAARDVRIVGNQAYVASADFGMAVVDVTTPSASRAVDGALPPFWGDRVAVDGSLAVATTRNVGLHVIDLGAAGGPQVVGALGGTMDGVAISGQYAYLLNVVPGNPGHTDLIVVSLAAPSAPAIVGRVTVTSGSDLVVVGTNVYIVGGSGGLRVVDVSVPTSPRIVGSVALAAGGSGVTVLNGYAYVADSSVVEIVNVQTPSRPVVVGSVAASSWAIAVAGTRAYVVDGLTLTILDVTSPTAPAVLSQSTAYSAQRIAAAGTTAYLASAQVNPANGQGGLYVVDASSPTTPRTLMNVYGGGDDWAVGVAGTLGIVTENGYGLRVVDVTNLAAPRVLATMTGTYTGASVSGTYGYVLQTVPGNPGHTDLVVLGLQTPTAPTVVGRLTIGGGSQLQVVGTLAYVAAGSVGLQIVDVSTPTSPRVVATVDTPGGAAAVAVLNGWAYVADGTAILTVDVRTPSAPVLRGTVATTANAIAVAGTSAYAVDGMQLKIVDVTNPAAPVLLSTTTAYGAQAIGVTGTAACLATPAVNHLDTSGGVYVLDVSSPTAPRLVKQVIVPGTTRTVQAGSGLCFAGDAAAALDVIDVAP